MIKHILAAVAVAAAVACSGTDSPTAPTAAPVTVPGSSPSTASSSIAAFTVSGQATTGRFTYWPRLALTAGSSGMSISRIEFRVVETGQIHLMTMDRAVLAGRTYTFEPELISAVVISQLAVTVSFTDQTGHPSQLSAVAAVPTFVAGTPSPALAITAFSVTGFMERTSFAYWPRLTLTASAGTGAVTVTRIQFELVGVGPAPTSRGPWRILAGTVVDLFSSLSYGEPEFYLTAASPADQVVVTISYVDDSGRAADARAVADVVR